MTLLTSVLITATIALTGATPLTPAAAEVTQSAPSCVTSVDKKKMPFYRPDEYRVKMTCSSIPDNVEVRGVLDLSLAVDEHTPWIRADRVGETVYSPYSFWGTTADTRIEWRYIG